MTDAVVEEKTEVPRGADETAMEDAAPPALSSETQHALHVLLVKLADRCLGHAHAKEQSDEPPSSDPDPFPRITAFGPSAHTHTHMFFFCLTQTPFVVATQGAGGGQDGAEGHAHGQALCGLALAAVVCHRHTQTHRNTQALRLTSCSTAWSHWQ